MFGLPVSLPGTATASYASCFVRCQRRHSKLSAHRIARHAHRLCSLVYIVADMPFITPRDPFASLIAACTQFPLALYPLPSCAAASSQLPGCDRHISVDNLRFRQHHHLFPDPPPSPQQSLACTASSFTMHAETNSSSVSAKNVHGIPRTNRTGGRVTEVDHQKYPSCATRICLPMYW